MSEVLNKLAVFQTDRDLHKQTFEPMNEATNIVEEVLESLLYDVPREQRANLKEEFIEFIMLLEKKGIVSSVARNGVTDEHREHLRVDSYFDMMTFSVGALMKLGYNPIGVVDEGSKEINSRVGSIIDGKFQKDLSHEAVADWYDANYTVHKTKDN